LTLPLVGAVAGRARSNREVIACDCDSDDDGDSDGDADADSDGDSDGDSDAGSCLIFGLLVEVSLSILFFLDRRLMTVMVMVMVMVMVIVIVMVMVSVYLDYSISCRHLFQQ
jgi:hypothetical protein